MISSRVRNSPFWSLLTSVWISNDVHLHLLIERHFINSHKSVQKFFNVDGNGCRQCCEWLDAVQYKSLDLIQWLGPGWKIGWASIACWFVLFQVQSGRQSIIMFLQDYCLYPSTCWKLYSQIRRRPLRFLCPDLAHGWSGQLAWSNSSRAITDYYAASYLCESLSPKSHMY